VLVTHGYRTALVQWLAEKGLEAEALETRYEGERDESGDIEPAPDAPAADVDKETVA
jgi:hypothetical protein